MDWDSENTEILLSIIIPCWNQWEFILDAIASVESALDILYEIIIVTPNILSLDQEELLIYFQYQGYTIEKISDNFDLYQALSLGIEKSTGRYIFLLFPHKKIRVNTLLYGIKILDKKPEIGVVYRNVENLEETLKVIKDKNFNRSQKLLNIESIFRRKFCDADLTKIVENFEKKGWKIYHISEPITETINFSQFHTEVELESDQFNDFSFSVQEQPLVSICIPSYNGERFIAEAISSALSQTYSPIELILSDDASTDKTVAIAQSFQANTSINFVILNHSNYGLAQNCNFCLTQAKGKYIKFLFQDDILTPNCIEEMVNLAEKDEKIGLVFSPRKICFLEGNESDKNLQNIYQDFLDLHKAWSNLKTIQWGQSLLSDPNLFQHPINKIGEPSTVLIRRTVFETVGLFDSELNQLVDWDMWLRIMSHYKIGFVNQVLSFFRLHSHQKTYQNIQENLSIDLSFYHKVYSHPCYDFMSSELRFRALCLYTINLNHLYLNTPSPTRSIFRDHLRKLRREVAEIVLHLPLIQLESMYLSSLGIIHRILARNKSFRKESLTEPEQVFIQKIYQNITSNDNKIIQYVLVFLLYQNTTQPQVQLDFSQIPPIIQKEIEKWMSIED